MMKKQKFITECDIANKILNFGSECQGKIQKGNDGKRTLKLTLEKEYTKQMKQIQKNN